jgi:catechol 2,3-dioxygenase-like lactoylglutathione lyase family enzyme
MTHRGFSHIGLSTLDLDKTRAFYEGVLGFKPVVADTITIEEGGHLRHMFFDVGGGQLIALSGSERCSRYTRKIRCGDQPRAWCSRRLLSFRFRGQHGSCADQKARRIARQGRGDHRHRRSRMGSIDLFKDPNGISLEYCCIVGELPDGDEMMRGQFTVPLGALELTDTLTKARSTGDRAKTGV